MATVFFIEDNPGWQDILGQLLETAGHQTRRATTIEVALDILSGKQRFDVIVFDLLLVDGAPTDDPFVWLDAFIQGMTARRLEIPPIIILTGIDVSKRDVIQTFTQYRGHIFGFFEKQNLEAKHFLQTVKDAVDSHSIRPRPKSFLQLLSYTLLMSAIILLTFAVLLSTVRQIPDPKTQQTILKVGGSVIVIIAIFLAMFSQNTKLEDVIGPISKIWRG